MKPITLSLITPFTMLSAADGLSKPNIIFILADDLGIGNVSCYGADDYKTPSIDKLASTGMRFTNGYTAALYGPSRARMWYVREAGWKLNRAGELYDMSDAPFTEKLIPSDSVDSKAIAARTRLSGALAKRNPAGGIPDDGDGTGRHANKANKKKSE